MTTKSNVFIRFCMFAPIVGSFLMWLIGIDTPVTQFLYGHSFQLLLISVLLSLALMWRRFDTLDWWLIGLIFLLFIFYTLTSDVRQATLAINAALPVSMLLVVSYRHYQWTTRDKQILLLIASVAVFSILARLGKELPQLVAFENLWKTDNQLEFIWINTNTIGAALLFGVMLITILVKSLSTRWSVRLWLIPISGLGLAGIWLSQSKTSFYILLLFLLLDNALPKKYLQTNRFILYILAIIFAMSPFFFYYCAQHMDMNLFTGRERIWHEFFEQFSMSKTRLLIGMPPFEASWKPLGTHNSYLLLLGRYGLFGYLTFSFFMLFLSARTFSVTHAFSKRQLRFFIGFVTILVYCAMEDSLLMYHWMPIIFSFFGLFERPAQKEKQSLPH